MISPTPSLQRALTAREAGAISLGLGGPRSAQVAELVDALDSGSSGRKLVEVRVFSWAPWRTAVPVRGIG
jgi:hypothetical protein